MKVYWWKFLGVALILYSVIWGLLAPVPARFILNESIRNLFYHVPMWFAMIILLLVAFICSIIYLASNLPKFDMLANQFTNSALVLGLLGILTGMVWAQYTWGAFWTSDPKLNGVAIGMLIYMGYIILRQAVEDPMKKGQVAGVFNVLAFPIFIVLIFILPRMNDSLHPGNGGNPGFNQYDLDNTMRPIFYGAVTGWILIGTWISQLRYRLNRLEIEEHDQV